MGNLIELSEVDVDLGGDRVLADVDLTLEDGQVLGVAGPNGSGKTTLLRLIATLVTPGSGRGQVLGARLGSPEVYAVRPLIGFVSHIPAVIGELSLRENLQHFARLTGVPESRVERALRAVGLDEASDRRGDDSSFGMLRRTEAARLLIASPRLLLLDEAHAGLDEPAQELIGALIRRTTGAGGAVVVVSHDEARLSQHTDSILHLRLGRLEHSA